MRSKNMCGKKCVVKVQRGKNLIVKAVSLLFLRHFVSRMFPPIGYFSLVYFLPDVIFFSGLLPLKLYFLFGSIALVGLFSFPYEVWLFLLFWCLSFLGLCGLSVPFFSGTLPPWGAFFLSQPPLVLFFSG